MNIPFSLAISNTSPHGVLWNPWGATVPTSVDNTVLTGLGETLRIRYDLQPPTRAVIVTGLVLMGDTDDAKVSLGIYDTELAAFHELYPIVATVVAGGGLVDNVLGLCGLILPLSATRIPVIKYTPGAGSVTITGQISVNVQQNFSDTNVNRIPSAFLQDEAAASLLNESDVAIISE